MKVMLVGINSKYIHPNLAIRYLKSNCTYPVDIKEFTIKDDINNIYNNIIKDNPSVVGFSVYIWNIEIIKILLPKLRKTHKNIKIILGGPEVSYEYDEFLKDNLADYVIYNEGEIAFNLLINALVSNNSLYDIQNLAYIKDNIIYKNSHQEIQDLDSLNNPYYFDQEDVINKIQYIELSRGCPYNCSYCLASLEKKVRYFNINTVFQNIIYLYSKGAKTFKFLDRTFNLKTSEALKLFKFIINNNFKNAIFQFEISGDILNDEIINYLINNCPKDLIRFEIGIQSIHDKVNIAVNRRQNSAILFKNIHRLRNSNVILHLDLIAGLPYDDLTSFEETFNVTFNLFAKELQLGILKLLKGTQLYYQQQEYGYVSSKTAPYEIIENNYLSESDMNKILVVEGALDLYWNKGFMNESVKKIVEHFESPFKFFYDLGSLYLKDKKTFHRYQLTDVFETIEKYLGREDFIHEIRYDYLIRHNIKPKIYWKNDVKKNEVIRLFHNQNSTYNLDSLYKYSVVSRYNDGYLIALYFPKEKIFHKIKA
ncbi:MAG: DUF4080 domain-containing protein [Tenericutes bacterium]|nr:DUF4080 domain-containing protein [Mycoplasmatota bacterium]